MTALFAVVDAGLADLVGAKPFALLLGFFEWRSGDAVTLQTIIQGVAAEVAVTEALCGRGFSVSLISQIDKGSTASLKAFVERRPAEAFPCLILLHVLAVETR